MRDFQPVQNRVITRVILRRKRERNAIKRWWIFRACYTNVLLFQQMVITFPHYLLLCCTFVQEKMQLFCLPCSTVGKPRGCGEYLAKAYVEARYKAPASPLYLYSCQMAPFEEREVGLGTRPLAREGLRFCTNVCVAPSLERVTSRAAPRSLNTCCRCWIIPAV